MKKSYSKLKTLSKTFNINNFKALKIVEKLIGFFKKTLLTLVLVPRLATHPLQPIRMI